MTKLFETGQMVWTCGVSGKIAGNAEFAKFVETSLKRHTGGDWGELTEEDKKENEFSMEKHLRLFSAYKKDSLPKIWIITEADRSATTVLFPDEY